MHSLAPSASVGEHLLDEAQRNLSLARAADHHELLDPLCRDLVDVIPSQRLEAPEGLRLALEGRRTDTALVHRQPPQEEVAEPLPRGDVELTELPLAILLDTEALSVLLQGKRMAALPSAPSRQRTS